ncbi:MAG TPA: hypothetical protein DD671_05880 [Balneolaceae bacterium]|nr:hypothetical protein [Balneola sp.]HBQ59154.1 hypothetical protein [Balneolaceae bacterium]|tara:strand:- start:64620 stop:65087 length:468 start_codon:yes stop_codon:yes gene_type:complete
MKLFDLKTGDWIEAEISLASNKDIDQIKFSKEFLFDWSQEKSNSVFKILERSSGNILGLISVTDFAKELRIHINLLEVSKPNTGRNKRIEGIAGRLISFVVKESFKKGYNGFVSLRPKTALVKHYKTKYGFKELGKVMVIDGIDALQLIRKFDKQ